MEDASKELPTRRPLDDWAWTRLGSPLKKPGSGGRGQMGGEQKSIPRAILAGGSSHK